MSEHVGVKRWWDGVGAMGGGGGEGGEEGGWERDGFVFTIVMRTRISQFVLTIMHLS